MLTSFLNYKPNAIGKNVGQVYLVDFLLLVGLESYSTGTASLKKFGVTLKEYLRAAASDSTNFETFSPNLVYTPLAISKTEVSLLSSAMWNQM